MGLAILGRKRLDGLSCNFDIINNERARQNSCEGCSKVMIELVTKEPLLSRVREIFREYQSFLGFDLCFQNFEEELATLPGKYAPPKGRLYLAIIDEQVVGCIALRPLEGNKCEMKRFFVRPQFRGQKVGRALVSKLIEEAREIGYSQMVLDTVPTQSIAQSLYGSLGFQEIEPYCYNPIEGTRYLGLDLSDSVHSSLQNNEQTQYWNRRYQSEGKEKPAYDLWLDKYAAILAESGAIPIIDLGCGFGNDTLYLHERGYQVISCDYSCEALKRLECFIDKPVTRLFDMKEGLPFKNQSAKIVIADLSLHYFCWLDTLKIVAEIGRVLEIGGYLLARVNSVQDINYGAGQGIAIEENYYNVAGKHKRFFDRVQLSDLFQTWEVIFMNESEMGRYENKKILWEVAVKKAHTVSSRS